MAQRADFVVIRENKAVAYCHKWGALGCLYAFAGGPKAAVEDISNMEQINTLDGVFAEGGYLIDFDQRVAIVYGYPSFDDDMDENINRINAAITKSELAYLEYTAPNWPGWKLTWDYRGTDTFIDYLMSRNITDISALPSSRLEETPPVSIQA